MNELIKINYDNDRPTVLARDLHEFLEVKTAYKDWFPRMCEYGFNEGVDFNPLKNERVQFEGNRQVCREVTDHQLTIEMAKELCMLQRNDKGKEARLYFINLEKQWNSPEMVMSRALKMAENKIKQLSVINSQLTVDVERMKPKEIFADAVTVSDSCILVGDLAKLLKQNGVNIGANRLFKWLRENNYLIKRKGSDYNTPTQKSMDLGLFEIKERTINNPDGSVRITRTPKVTGKGQLYFVNKFKEMFVA